MKTAHAQIIQERLDNVKKLMEYLDKDGIPKNQKSQEYFFYDWIQGQTIYKRDTDKQIAQYYYNNL